MNVALRRVWTREEFLDWVEGQRERFEYDGFEPVAMVGGTSGHSRIHINIALALGTRLRGSPCMVLGPDAGVATSGNAVRYPDALVTWTAHSRFDRLIPGVVVVLEVVSPTSGRDDKVTKLLEYASVPTIRRYVVLESDSASALVFSRAEGDAPWHRSLVEDAGLVDFPELGISVPLTEFYDGIAF